MSDTFRASLRELAATAERVAAELGPDLDEALRLVRDTVKRGGTLYFCGNGGSAADAQHLATEYVVRYMRNRPASGRNQEVAYPVAITTRWASTMPSSVRMRTR